MAHKFGPPPPMTGQLLPTTPTTGPTHYCVRLSHGPLPPPHRIPIIRTATGRLYSPPNWARSARPHTASGSPALTRTAPLRPRPASLRRGPAGDGGARGDGGAGAAAALRRAGRLQHCAGQGSAPSSLLPSFAPKLLPPHTPLQHRSAPPFPFPVAPLASSVSPPLSPITSSRPSTTHHSSVSSGTLLGCGVAAVPGLRASQLRPLRRSLAYNAVVWVPWRCFCAFTRIAFVAGRVARHDQVGREPRQAGWRSRPTLHPDL